MNRLGLHRFSVLLAAATLFLVVAGATVVSKGAGLSVPDWPLSYGKVMPEMTGGVFYEHGHRMIATAVGFLTVVLAVWLFVVEDRRWMKMLGLAAVVAVILQGVLGGLTVLFLLPKAVSIGHACLAQAFFSLTVAMAVFTSPEWRKGPQIVEDRGTPSLRSLAVMAPLSVLAQIALGAAYRHKAFGIVPHVVWAFGVMIAVMMLGVFALTQFEQHRPLRRWSIVVLVLTSAQLILGIGAYLARVLSDTSPNLGSWMVGTTVAHVALGALVLGATTALSMQVLRHVITVRGEAGAGAPGSFAPSGRSV